MSMKRVWTKKDAVTWTDMLKSICGDTDCKNLGSGWHTDEIDYAYVLEYVWGCICEYDGWALWSDDACICCTAWADPLTPNNKGVYEQILRTRPKTGGVQVAREECMRIAIEEHDAKKYFALNVPYVRPDITAEDEERIMTKKGYKILSRAWYKHL